MAKPGQIVLLEQPELHLHPALQQKLADFLLAMVDSGRQIIVETHSEYLITRLRLRTVQVPENADLFNIVFATNSPEDGTKYVSTQVDSNGSLNTWPEGFFDEATSDLEEMMDVVLNREER
jgi:predicted ATPase